MCHVPATDEKPPPPNIIFIMADDMGYGDVSALHPGSKIRTPHLDRMAREGMIFTDAHSGSSVCTPTRYGVLTGRYCWRTRLKKSVLWNYQNSLMDPTRLNVASFLKQQGYYTAMVGKWHLGLEWVSISNPGAITDRQDDVDFTKPFGNGPRAMGFDEFFGINASLDMPPYVFLKGDRAVGGVPTQRTRAFGRPGLVGDGLNPDDFQPAFIDRTLNIIRAQEIGKPFFLYLALAAPHTPIAPSSDFLGSSGLTGKLGAYADFCVEADHGVGASSTHCKQPAWMSRPW